LFQGVKKKRFSESPGTGKKNLLILNQFGEQICLINVEIIPLNYFVEVLDAQREIFH
jgi:hypothetical protein